MGFLPDVEKIVDKVPTSRQTMLFSATMPGQIVAMARRYMDRPTHIRAADAGDESATVDAIEQHVWRTHPMDKMEIIARVLQAEGRGLTMIFSRTKRRAQRIAEELSERGFAAASVHGDLGQGAREQALRAFRNGKVDVLAATDVAARGIDVDGVTHVINYECPDDEKTYVHRIGRTGRAGESGVAVTLVDWEDLARWAMIDRALKLPFDKPLETYSTSDHIFTGLGIPKDAKGFLSRANRTREGLAAEELEDLGETGKSRGGSKTRNDDRRSNDRNDSRGNSRNRDGGGRRDGGNRDGGGGGGNERNRDGGGGNERTVSGGRDASRPPRKRNRTRSGGSAAQENTQPESAPAQSAPKDVATTEVASTETRPPRKRQRNYGAGSGGAGAPPAFSDNA